MSGDEVTSWLSGVASTDERPAVRKVAMRALSDRLESTRERRQLYAAVQRANQEIEQLQAQLLAAGSRST